MGGQRKRFYTYLGTARCEPELCNYDISLLSVAAMSSLWSQGVADPIVVVIKLQADDGYGDIARGQNLQKEAGCQRQRIGHVNEMRSEASITDVMRLENTVLKPEELT